MIRYCEKCYENGNIAKALERHHKFSQIKKNRQLYPEYIDHEENIQYLCYDCHHNKPVDKWTEKEFCENFGIGVRSKSGK
jgi:hypothetical protein